MRCYNGCPDKEYQAFLDARLNALKEVQKLNPEAWCTYHHPHGGDNGGWVVHCWGNPISRYHNDQLDALNEAIKILLEKGENK